MKVRLVFTGGTVICFFWFFLIRHLLINSFVRLGFHDQNWKSFNDGKSLSFESRLDFFSFFFLSTKSFRDTSSEMFFLWFIKEGRSGKRLGQTHLYMSIFGVCVWIKKKHQQSHFIAIFNV